MADAPPDIDQVRLALDARVRRFIRAHAGDVDVVSVSEDGDVRLRFYGACTGCPALGTTFAGAVLPEVENVPGVRSVRADGVNISPAALERIRQLSQKAPRMAGESAGRGRP